MTRAELIEKMARDANLTKAATRSKHTQQIKAPINAPIAQVDPHSGYRPTCSSTATRSKADMP
jgi:hypothetical protein